MADDNNKNDADHEARLKRAADNAAAAAAAGGAGPHPHYHHQHHHHHHHHHHQLQHPHSAGASTSSRFGQYPAGASGLFQCVHHRFGSSGALGGDAHKIMLVQGADPSGAAAAAQSAHEAGSAAAAAAAAAAAKAAAVCTDRIRALYAHVNEDDFPLPRAWSSLEKCSSIGLTQNNLRVHYKGVGKNHNDAASVRTAHPIPAACGLYYFEVKIISKGRDGYMGIGLTAQHFKMNRLPGWDKQSFGYHGDDGNSFCSSGNGQPYGPTFTTGDVIGCGVNLVNNTCFYTKNGHHLGTAFRDLPSKLYPTVGLQTPGEVVDANFGQDPFRFDISDMVEELRTVTQASIYDNPLPDGQGDWSATMHKLVSSYLVHHGYTKTAESFARTTNTPLQEDIASIRNRQKIIKMVMNGRMGKAIEHTQKSYPTVLESNLNLLFTLKCRQFVEMVNGSDFETSSTRTTTSTTTATNNTTNKTAAAAANAANPAVPTSVIQSTKAYKNGGGQPLQSQSTTASPTADATGAAGAAATQTPASAECIDADYEVEDNDEEDADCEIDGGGAAVGGGGQQHNNGGSMSNSSSMSSSGDPAAKLLSKNNAHNNSSSTTANANADDPKSSSSGSLASSSSSSVASARNNHKQSLAASAATTPIISDYAAGGGGDVEMEAPQPLDAEAGGQHSLLNGSNSMAAHKNGSSFGGSSEDMEVDMIVQQQPAIGKKSSKSGVERMLEFGRELFQLSQRLESEQGANEANQKMLEDAFSLLAYSNPWSSPLGWQLCPSRRETVCAALNSAILESLDYPWRPPLENCIAHSDELLSLMACSSIGACAFASIEDVLQSADPAAH